MCEASQALRTFATYSREGGTTVGTVPVPPCCNVHACGTVQKFGTAHGQETRVSDVHVWDTGHKCSERCRGCVRTCSLLSIPSDLHLFSSCLRFSRSRMRRASQTSSHSYSSINDHPCSKTEHMVFCRLWLYVTRLHTAQVMTGLVWDRLGLVRIVGIKPLCPPTTPTHPTYSFHRVGKYAKMISKTTLSF